MILASGCTAPGFELAASGAERERLALADLIATGPALLAFFKASCPVCSLSFPVWGELARRYGDVVAVVAVAQDPLSTARPWLDAAGFDAPVLDDSDRFATSSAYQLDTVPSLVLVGSDGRVAFTSEGWDRDQANALDVELAEMVGRSSPGPLSTPADGLPPQRPG